MHLLTPWIARTVFLMAGLAPMGAAVAAEADRLDRSQRSRIQTERRDAQLRFDQQMTVCAQQFAAAACQDSARSERRATLDALRHQQLVLHDAQRRDRAAARLRSIQGKTVPPSPPLPPSIGAAQAAQAAASAPARRERAPRTNPLAPPSAAALPAAPRQVEPSRPATSAADAERRRLQSERRVSESQRHRLDALQRNAERDQRRPPAAGLPVPASSP